MSELNARARGLLSSVSYADEPTQADYDRVHAALEARIAVGVAVGVAVTLGAAETAAAGATGAGSATACLASTASAGAAATSAASASATAGAASGVAASIATGGAGAGSAAALAGASAGLASAGASAPVAATVGGAIFGKVAVWVALAGAVAVGTTAVATHPFAPSVADRPAVSAVGPVAVASPAPRSRAPMSPQTASVAANVAEPSVPVEAPSPVAVPAAPSPVAPVTDALEGKASLPVAVPRAAQGHVATHSSASRGADPAPSPIDAEIALLRDARQALRDGSAERALALLDASARQFPDGALAEDRTAERILTLCALGRGEEATALAGRFLREHPRSPYGAAVRASCGGTPKN